MKPGPQFTVKNVINLHYDINCLFGNSANGNNSLSALVSLGLQKNMGPGTPAANLPILLVDAMGALHHVSTNSAGYFSIAHLPSGNISLLPDVPGLDTTMSLVPDLGANTFPDTILLRLNAGYLSLVEPTSAMQFPNPTTQSAVFPNPTSGWARLLLDQDFLEKDPLQVTASNALGHNVPVAVQFGVADISVNFSMLPTGIYLLHVQHNDASTVHRVMVSKP